MKPSSRDIILLSVIAVAFSLIGFGIGWRSKSVPAVNEDDKFIKIYAHIDSVKNSIKANNIRIDTLFNHEKQDDINRVNNFKNLANELKQVRRFTTSTRSKYLDSLAASEGL